MKNALLALAAIAVSASAFAQGTLIFKTLGVQKADGSTYNVPLFASNGNFVFGNSSTPAGTLPGGVTVGLFTAGSGASATPFAQGMLGTTAATGLFVVTPPSQTVAVPNAPAGSTPTIIIRAWQGQSFAIAQAGGQFGHNWGEWTLTTRPLGGDPGGGSLPIIPPTLTGWGPENGTGYELNGIPEPSTLALGALGIGALLLRRRK